MRNEEVAFMSQTLFIDGKWVGAKKGETRQIINPYNQEHIETVSEGDREDAVRAILCGAPRI